MKSEEILVAGVGMTPFMKPTIAAPYPKLAEAAVRDALADAGVGYDAIGQAYVGYCYGDTTSGQRALYEIGMSGVPIFNVNNACATGSSALYLARQAVASGATDCALALGFEQMVPGALGEIWKDRPGPLDHFLDVIEDLQGPSNAPLAIRLFGAAGVEYAGRHGTNPLAFAAIASKARRHAEHNERAIFRSPVTPEQVLESAPMYGLLTRLQCCPPTCGAAAAILCTRDFARRHGIAARVAIRAQACNTDTRSTFDARSAISCIGYDMAAATARQVYEGAGIGPDDVDVVELHDCFTVNELLTYEALGLCAEGQAERFIMDGDNTYGGAIVTNPSGGLLSKGHPLGATGLAQCAELNWQLRGECGPRQVDSARVALQHNLGLGGACVVTLYESVRA
jgi:acetyl-CoA acetyltransferase